MKNKSVSETTEREAGQRSREAATAFIIDDDRLMADLLARRLERRGIAPRVFDDGERLLAELAERSPSVLFSDLQMPCMGGAKLISLARGNA